MKKVVSFSLLSLALFASEVVASSHFHSGFYVGAQGGYSHFWGRMKDYFDDGHNVNNSITRTSSLKKKSGVIGEILVGGRYVFHNGFTLGGDVSFGYSGQRLSSRLLHRDVILFGDTVKRTYVVTPGITMGKIFSSKLHSFIKLGLGISRFKNKLEDLPIPIAGRVSPYLSFRSPSTHFGFSPTLGLEYAWTQRISLLGSMNYEYYKKLRKNYVNPLVPPPVSFYTSTTRASFLNIKVGVLFKL